MRYVRNDALGLAITPTALDCVGADECIYVETGRGCYPSRHHKYFEEEYYKAHSDLAWEFREDPNNIITMARCQEDRIHDRYDGARVPTAFIMELFLEESAVLQDVGALTKKVLSADKALIASVVLAERVEAHAARTGNYPDYDYWGKVSRTAENAETFRRRRSAQLANCAGFSAITPALILAHGYDRLLPEIFDFSEVTGSLQTPVVESAA